MKLAHIFLMFYLNFAMCIEFLDKTTNKCEQASHLMNLVVAALLILSHTLPHLGQFNLDPPVIQKKRKKIEHMFSSKIQERI